MDVRELLDEDQQLLGREGGQADHGSEKVHHTLAPKAPLREAASQRLVRIEPTPAVLDALRRTTHDDAQVGGLALERVIVHCQYLLIVVLAADRVGDLVQVHELVHEHDQALVARATQEAREELEVVVPVGISDDDAHTELASGLGLGAVLRAKPLDD